jgi:hypothetical protein
MGVEALPGHRRVAPPFFAVGSWRSRRDSTTRRSVRVSEELPAGGSVHCTLPVLE